MSAFRVLFAQLTGAFIKISQPSDIIAATQASPRLLLSLVLRLRPLLRLFVRAAPPCAFSANACSSAQLPTPNIRMQRTMPCMPL